MKRKTISIMLILFLASFVPLWGKYFEKHSGFVSAQGIVAESKLLAFGGGYEYFFHNNVSISADIMTIGFYPMVLGSLDFTWHIKLPKLENVDLMIGGGPTVIVPFFNAVVVKWFVGTRVFVSPKVGFYVKVQNYLVDESRSTVLLFGASYKVN